MASAIPIGVFTHSLPGDGLVEKIQAGARLGIKLFQVGPFSPDYFPNGNFDAARLENVVKALKDTDSRVATLNACFEAGDNIVDREDYSSIGAIRRTGGLGYMGDDAEKIVKNRKLNIMDTLAVAAYFRDIGLLTEQAIVTTHVGFTDDTEQQKGQITASLCDILGYARSNDTYLAVETGTEPVNHLVEYIRKVESESGVKGRLGLNFDPANLELYGTQRNGAAVADLVMNPELIFGVHAKEAKPKPADFKYQQPHGNWPDGCEEVVIGTGAYNWVGLIGQLQRVGYKGAIIIEKEMPQPVNVPREDAISQAFKYLQEIQKG